MDKLQLSRQLEKHEGLRLKPYLDTEGKLTIGIGRNLEGKGISKDEAYTMLRSDIDEFATRVSNELPFFYKLNDARQNVLINMAFNMGVNGLLSFKMTLRLIEYGDFENASHEMLNSKWADQVGVRAVELSEQMRMGEFK